MPDELRLCAGKLARREGRIDETLELLARQTETAFDIVGIATEIDTPESGIDIGGQIGIYAINEPCMFAERAVQAGVHGRPAEDIVEECHGISAFVGAAKSSGSDDDVCLMRTLLYDFATR